MVLPPTVDAGWKDGLEYDLPTHHLKEVNSAMALALKLGYL
jgi:hypothetical protein